MAVIYCGVNGLLENVPLDKVKEFEQNLIQTLKLRDQQDVLDVLKSGKLTPEVEEKLIAAAREVANAISAE